MTEVGSKERRERRRAPRAPARLEAGYEDATRQVFLRTADLSEHGAFLVSTELPERGARARVTLEIPGHSALLRLTAVVTRRAVRPHSGFAIAFDLASLSLPARTALRRFVQQQATSA